MRRVLGTAGALTTGALAVTFITTSATAGEPYVFAEPRVGWLLSGEPPDDRDWVGGGLALGGGYRQTFTLFQLRAEGFLSGMGYGGDAQEGSAGTFTVGGGGGAGFEIVMIDIMPVVHLGLGSFGDKEEVTNHFWIQPQFELSGRIDHADSATWIGGRFGADFFATSEERSATSYTLGFFVAHTFQKHQGGWYFMN